MRGPVASGNVARTQCFGEDQPVAKVGATCRKAVNHHVAVPVHRASVGRCIREKEPVLAVDGRLSFVGHRRNACIDCGDRSGSSGVELGVLVRVRRREPDRVMPLIGGCISHPGQYDVARTRRRRFRQAPKRGRARQEILVEMLGINIGYHDICPMSAAVGGTHPGDPVG